MKILIAVLLVVHGLIVAAQSSSSLSPGKALANPSWLSWFPARLGQSWLLLKLGTEQSFLARAGGILWLAGGLALVAAGLGIFGFIIPFTWWRGLALAGAVISLVMLAVYAHPFYILGVGASVLLLAALLSKQWMLLARLGL